jgi:hypothetical protein
MPKPFQFSIGRMLCALTCFGLTTLSLTWFVGHLNDQSTGIFLLSYFVFFISAGSGGGTIIGKPFWGAIWGLGFAVGLYLLVGIITSPTARL